MILADEPTGNLDTHAGDEIAHLLRDVARHYNRTVIMVTHDPRIAAYADRIVFLKDGKVVDDAMLAHDEKDNARMLADRMQNINI